MIYLLLTSQFVTAGVFSLSAYGKVREQSEFARSLADFHVPPRVRVAVAAAVTAVEVAVIPLALLPATAVAGLALGAVLLLGFAAVIGLTLRRGRRPRCRCFGAVGAPLRGAHVVRNGVLAAIATAGAVLAATHQAVAPPIGSFVVTGVLAAALLAAVANFDDLVEVVAPRAG
ncbi:MauE/DoxX family redox-associated membrane protein [Pseudonocardia sichuanensis]|uniref:Methylamine utilisation protein MauE domain-containing protein n=1 Tax=Pseudonocardia kunmingensis TaxID=630975 RepID=A0A543E3J2_9PSEU|nr:MauE/DoxX family redox-associated membrane protein [Pseudonocardia kunmingensis]TQM16161.1 hypothetical protein FB558_2968 [Pseudonocardia kunmingensis]